MRLPENTEERYKLYRNLLRQCESSRDERRQRAHSDRTWYLAGTDSGGEAVYNKLAEFVDTSTAYIYAPESVKFGVALPPRYGDRFTEEQGIVRDELQRLWHEDNSGLVLDALVEWAHVWESSISKMVVSRGIPYPVMIPNPSDFCVLDESVTDLNRQEAMVHFYPLNVPTFRRVYWNRPDLEVLVSHAEKMATPSQGSGQDTLPPTISTILVAATQPTLVGNVQGMGNSAIAAARSEDPVVWLGELWVWDDDAEDYRVVTIFDPTLDVFSEDRAQRVYMEGEHPFDLLSLYFIPDYLFGVSSVRTLRLLQNWRETRSGQVDEILGRQLDPPLFFNGVSGMNDEKANLLRKKGGNVFNSMPNGDVKNMAPTMPADAFAEIDAIDRMFANRAGLPQMLQGQGEPGLRAGDQVGALATLGSARLRRRAMRVEKFIESVATKKLRLWRTLMKESLLARDGKKFYMSQLPADMSARVSSHSASPLYAEIVAHKALLLKQGGAIGDARFVEMIDPPMAEMVIAEARAREEARAKHAERIMQLRETLATHGKKLKGNIE